MAERMVHRPYGLVPESSLSKNDALLQRIQEIWREALHANFGGREYSGSVIAFGAGFEPASFADGGVLFFISKNGKRKWERLFNYYGVYDQLYESAEEMNRGEPRLKTTEPTDNDVDVALLLFTEEDLIPRIIADFDDGENGWTYYRGAAAMRSVNMITGEY